MYARQQLWSSAGSTAHFKTSHIMLFVFYFCPVRLNAINLNGWTPRNRELKSDIIKYGGPQLVCAVETHLKADDGLHVEGYRWYGSNRKGSPRGKGSGGVGQLVRNDLLEKYEVCVRERDEGLLCLMFSDRENNFKFLISSLYLPPQSSRYSNRVDFFNKLLNVVHDNKDTDFMLFAGDLNARIGATNDVLINRCVSNSPIFPERASIDPVCNSHGMAFLHFLHNAQCCILNGRIGAPKFTCFRPNGQSAVDYGFVTYKSFKRIIDMNIFHCPDIVKELQIENKIWNKSRIPDHSLLQIDFSLKEK